MQHNYSMSTSNKIDLKNTTFFYKKKKSFNPGKGLCPVEVSTGHVRIQTRVQEWICVQEWTRVHNPMCPVETSTGHKPRPLIKGKVFV